MSNDVKVKDGLVVWTLPPEDARNLSYVLEHRGVGWEADARHLFEAADRAEGVTHE